MLSNILNIEGASVLSQEQQKSILGGEAFCGVKVEGVWHHQDGAESLLGTNVDFEVEGSIHVVGFVTNWCCNSCPWNTPQ